MSGNGPKDRAFLADTTWRARCSEMVVVVIIDSPVLDGGEKLVPEVEVLGDRPLIVSREPRELNKMVQ